MGLPTSISPRAGDSLTNTIEDVLYRLDGLVVRIPVAVVLVLGRITTSPEMLGFVGVGREKISMLFHVQRILLFMLLLEFCVQFE